MNARRRRVTVVTGGSTPERPVALAGAREVVKALRSVGHEVTVVDTCTGAVKPADETSLLSGAIDCAPPPAAQLRELAAREDLPGLLSLEPMRAADVLFLVLHGRQGEGGALQALLELKGLTFTGSDAVGSVLAMDKDVAKRLMAHAGIPTPSWRLWPAGADQLERWRYPVIVKPSRVGSSVGLTVARSAAEVGPAVETALAYDDEVLIEAFLAGRELTVGVLGDQALGVGEIRCESGIFDFHGKYTAGVVEEIFPAEIDAELAARARGLALAVHRALKLRDFSRVDFRLDDLGNPSCLEANTLPGMTTMSLLPQSAAVEGWSFPALCERIVELALARRRL